MAKRKPEGADPPSPPPPLVVEITTQFERDLKRLEKRGKDVEKLRAVIASLRAREPLPLRNRDHAMTGQ